MDTLYQIVSGVGGGILAVIALWALLGRLIEHAVQERIRATYAERLAGTNTDRETTAARTRAVQLRQIEVYQNIYAALRRLEAAGDALWNAATDATLETFAMQLEETRTVIEGHSLFLEPEHRAEVRGAITAFADFRVGKARLIELRGRHAPAYELRAAVADNAKLLAQYRALVNRIEVDFSHLIWGA